jgi:hypothetical protein
MAIDPLLIPVRTAASSTGYAEDMNLVTAKINELATAMGISKLTIAAAVGAGNPAADMNQVVAKINELIGGGGTPTPATLAITSIDPSAAKAGDTIILTGTGFTGALNVLFAGVAAGSGKFSVLSDTQITVTVPNVSAGSNPVQVVGTSATSSARAFIVQAAAANIIPVASPDIPASLTLPSSQAVLNVTATDTDGTITGYQWRQVTGPANVVGMPSTAQSPVVSGIVQAGTYQFGVKAIDDKGAYSTEQYVNLVVKPDPSGVRPMSVLVIGNSIMRDLGNLSDGRVLNANGPGPYFFRLLLESALGRQLTSYDVSAIYGQTTGNVLDSFPTQVESYIRASQAAAPNVDVAVFYSEWINGGLNHAESPQKMYDDAVILCNKTVALSTATSQVKFFIASPTDCDLGAGNPTWKTLADGVTSLLLANPSNAPWFLSNVRANTAVGVDGSALTHLYVREDGGQWYHQAPAGYVEIANEFGRTFAQAYSLTIPSELTTFSVGISGNIANMIINAGRWVRVFRQKSSSTYQRSPTFSGLVPGDYNFEAYLLHKPSNILSASGKVQQPAGGPVFKILSQTDADPATGASGVITFEFVTGTAPGQYEYAEASGSVANTPWQPLTSNTFSVPQHYYAKAGLVFRPINGSNSYDNAVYNTIEFHDPNPQVYLETVSASSTQLVIKTREGKYSKLNCFIDGKFYSSDPNFLAVIAPVGQLTTTIWALNPALTPGEHTWGAYNDGQENTPPVQHFTI